MLFLSDTEADKLCYLITSAGENKGKEQAGPWCRCINLFQLSTFDCRIWNS